MANTLHQLAESITSENHKAALQTYIVNAITEILPAVEEVNPFNLAPSQRDLLASFGIQSSPSAAAIHPHAVHKVLENHFLFSHFPHYIKTPGATIAFMKQFKFDCLKDKCPRVRAQMKLVNPILSVEDLCRYREGPVNHPIVQCDTPTLIMQDALHYYQPGQLIALFKQNPNLRDIIGTLVIPPETMLGLESFYPEVYQVNYTGNMIQYIPEGHYAGAYEQPLAAFWWLKTRSLSYTDENNKTWRLYINIKESIMAHHLVHISRVEAKKSQKIYQNFASPRLTLLPDVFPCTPQINRLVPYDLAIGLFRYAKSIKNNTEKNLEAKLRSELAQRKYRISEPAAFILVKFLIQLVQMKEKINLTSTMEMHNPITNFFTTTFGALQDLPQTLQLRQFFKMLDITEHHFTVRLDDLELSNLDYYMDNAWPYVEYSFEEVDFLFPRHTLSKGVTIKPTSVVTPETTLNEPTVVPLQEEETEEIVQELKPAQKLSKKQKKKLKKSKEAKETTTSPVQKVEEVVETPPSLETHTDLTRRNGRNCGLFVFLDAGFDIDSVRTAYAAARTHYITNRQYYPTRTEFRNFNNTNEFEWLSATELTIIAQFLDVEINIHTPTNCVISETGGLPIYHTNNNHWTLEAGAHRCL